MVMTRWTNGLPDATKRPSTMMAQRGLSASQPGCARLDQNPVPLLHKTRLRNRGPVSEG